MEDPPGHAIKSALAQLTGLDIQYYVLLDMQGFVGVIDLVGGINVHVTETTNDRIKPIVPDGPHIDIVVEPGDHHFDGLTGLGYVTCPLERAADTAAEEALWKDSGRYCLAEVRRICDLNQAEITRQLADGAALRSRHRNHPHDYPISTIPAIVENLGGRLELTAGFGPARVPVDLPGPPEEPPDPDREEEA